MRLLAPILLFLVLGELFAAPSAPQLAINNATGECGRFWEGDEDTRYELPAGWKTVDEAGLGCNFTYQPNVDLYDKCCRQLGYPYVPEVGVLVPYPESRFLGWAALLLLAALLAVAYLWARNRQKAG